MELHSGFTLWFTGMSGAGKSTLAGYVASRLPLIGRRVELLDGAEVDSLFPEVPRASERAHLEHGTRTLGWMARLLTRNGVIAVVTSLSPYREVREEVRRSIGRYFEVEVEAPWEVLEKRDPRGYYKRGMAGEFTDIIGYHEPYEASSAEIKIETSGEETVEELGRLVFDRLFNHGFLSRRECEVLIHGGTFQPVTSEADEEIDPEEAREAMIDRRLEEEKRARGRAATEVVKLAPKSGAKSRTKKAGAAELPAARVAAATVAAKVAKPARKATQTAAGATKAASKPTRAAAKTTTTAARATKAAPSTAKAAAKTTKAAARVTKAAARTTKAASTTTKAATTATKVAATKPKAATRTTKAAATKPKAAARATKAAPRTTRAAPKATKAAPKATRTAARTAKAAPKSTKAAATTTKTAAKATKTAAKATKAAAKTTKAAAKTTARTARAAAGAKAAPKARTAARTASKAAGGKSARR